MLSAKLFFFRFIFGKFSYPYQEKLHKTARHHRHRKKFLMHCSKVDALSHYKDSNSGTRVVPVFPTDHSVLFNNQPWEVGFKSFRRQRPKFSCYDIQRYGDHYWRRIGYKERIFNAGVTSIYHFIDGRYFFGEFFFSDARKVDVHTVAQTLLKKYTGKTDTPGDDFRISGKNSFIHLHNNGINFSIKYVFTGNPEINRKISEVLEYNPLGAANATPTESEQAI